MLDVSPLVEPDDIVEDDVSLLPAVELEELGVEDVVPLAPMLDVPVLPVLALGLELVELLVLGLVLELVLGVELVVPLAPMLDVLGVVLELDVLGFAPPPPEVAPADEPEAPLASEPLEPLDWAIATPPMARAAAAASVVRIFLDMS